MRLATCFALTLAVFLDFAAADTATGLYLRAVVDEKVEAAVKMTFDDGETVFVSPVAVITPADVVSAKVSGEREVSIRFEFTPAAGEGLGEATKVMIGERIAIIIGDQILSTPVVLNAFSTGVQVTGSFTREWADSVVEAIEVNRKD